MGALTGRGVLNWEGSPQLHWRIDGGSPLWADREEDYHSAGTDNFCVFSGHKFLPHAHHFNLLARVPFSHFFWNWDRRDSDHPADCLGRFFWQEKLWLD